MSDWARELTVTRLERRVKELEERVKQLEEMNAMAGRAVDVLESQCDQLAAITHTCDTWGVRPSECIGCQRSVRKPTPV